MSKRRARKKQDAPQHGIAPDLEPLAVPIDDVTPDAGNVKRHAAGDLEAVKTSLREYGQVKPVVIDRETGRILAGHGVHAAAKALGWSHIAAVRVAYDPTRQKGFMIADNRTAELSQWDTDALNAALEEMAAAETLYLAGFREVFDLGAILESSGSEAAGEASASEESGGSGEPQLDGMQYRIVVTCEDEQHQAELLERFDAEGIEAKALIA